MWLETLSNRIPVFKLDRLGISQQTSVDFSLIFLANLVNNGSNFLINVIVARFFGHEIFALFSIAVNVALTTLTFSEFGMNLTMVRLYKFHEANHIRSRAVLQWNLYFKMAVILLLALIALSLSGRISEWLTKTSDRSFLIGAALVTGGILGLWSYLRAFFQSLDLFKKIAYVTFAFAFLKLAFLVLFVGFSKSRDAEILFLGVYLLPALLLVLLVFLQQKESLPFWWAESRGLSAAGREIISYSKWVAISSISFMLIQRSLIFIVAARGDLRQVSILSAALLFTGVFSMLNDSVRQILFPRVARLDAQEIEKYRKKLGRVVPMYFLFSAGVIAILSLFLHYVLGALYRDSLPLFWITGAGMAVVTGIGFFTIVVHTIRMPHVEAFVNAGRLLMMVMIGAILDGRYGVTGVAIAFSGIIVMGEALMAIILSRRLRMLSYD